MEFPQFCLSMRQLFYFQTLYLYSSHHSRVSYFFTAKQGAKFGDTQRKVGNYKLQQGKIRKNFNTYHSLQSCVSRLQNIILILELDANQNRSALNYETRPSISAKYRNRYNYFAPFLYNLILNPNYENYIRAQPSSKEDRQKNS